MYAAGSIPPLRPVFLNLEHPRPIFVHNSCLLLCVCHGSRKQSPHHSQHPIEMAPVIGVNLHALENGGNQGAEHHDSPILPWRSHQHGFESNCDSADDQENIGNAAQPSVRRKRVDVDVVRILPEDFIKLDRTENRGRSSKSGMLLS